jgi:hypothetical protein
MFAGEEGRRLPGGLRLREWHAEMGTPRSWTGNSSLIGGGGAVLLFWSGNALSLVPLHMLLGLSTVTRLGR